MGKFIDLTGHKYGKLTVIHRVEDRIRSDGSHETRWRCLCDCGNETEASSRSLRAKKAGVRSCGCLANGGQKGVKDRTGMRYGHLLVLERAEDFIDATGHSFVQWKCRCDCGRETILKSTALTMGTKSCGYCRISEEYQYRVVITESGKKMVDLTGLTFNKLTVVERGPDYVMSNGRSTVRYWCRCSCGNPKLVLVQAPSLKSGKAKSCGCQKRDSFLATRKYNRYEVCPDFMIGYTDSGRPFFFDKADYDRVKEQFWTETPRGYIAAAWRGEGEKQTVFLHRFIMEAKEGEIVDHINHDTFDNRRCNLRIVDHYESQRNIGLSKANTSGYKGVTLKKGRWCAFINHNDQDYHLGSFDTPEEAAEARRKAEIELYGEHSYEQSIAAVPRIEGIPWAEPIRYYANKDRKAGVAFCDGMEGNAMLDVTVAMDNLDDPVIELDDPVPEFEMLPPLPELTAQEEEALVPAL